MCAGIDFCNTTRRTLSVRQTQRVAWTLEYLAGRSEGMNLSESVEAVACRVVCGLCTAEGVLALD